MTFWVHPNPFGYHIIYFDSGDISSMTQDMISIFNYHQVRSIHEMGKNSTKSHHPISRRHNINTTHHMHLVARRSRNLSITMNYVAVTNFPLNKSQWYVISMDQRLKSIEEAKAYNDRLWGLRKGSSRAEIGRWPVFNSGATIVKDSQIH